MLASCTSTGSSGTSATAGTASPAQGACGGTTATLSGALAVITDPIGCPGGVNTYYSEQLRPLGVTWTAPRFIAYRDGQIPQDACGAKDPQAADFESNAFYCRLDDTVAYSSDFLGLLDAKGGPTYPMFVLMHELGHRATTLTHRTGAVSRSEENQADCLAGAESRFTHDAGRTGTFNIVKGGYLFFSLGDSGGKWFGDEPSTAPDAHGTPRERAEAFALGYFKGINECWKVGASQDGTLPDISLSLLKSLFG